MCRVRITPKSGKNSVEYRIREPEDAKNLLIIMAKNGYAATLYGDEEGEKHE